MNAETDDSLSTSSSMCVNLDSKERGLTGTRHFRFPKVNNTTHTKVKRFIDAANVVRPDIVFKFTQIYENSKFVGFKCEAIANRQKYEATGVTKKQAKYSCCEKLLENIQSKELDLKIKKYERRRSVRESIRENLNKKEIGVTVLSQFNFSLLRNGRFKQTSQQHHVFEIDLKWKVIKCTGATQAEARDGACKLVIKELYHVDVDQVRQQIIQQQRRATNRYSSSVVSSVVSTNQPVVNSSRTLVSSSSNDQMQKTTRQFVVIEDKSRPSLVTNHSAIKPSSSDKTKIKVNVNTDCSSSLVASNNHSNDAVSSPLVNNVTSLEVTTNRTPLSPVRATNDPVQNTVNTYTANETLANPQIATINCPVFKTVQSLATKNEKIVNKDPPMVTNHHVTNQIVNPPIVSSIDTTIDSIAKSIGMDTPHPVKKEPATSNVNTTSSITDENYPIEKTTSLSVTATQANISSLAVNKVKREVEERKSVPSNGLIVNTFSQLQQLLDADAISCIDSVEAFIQNVLVNLTELAHSDASALILLNTKLEALGGESFDIVRLNVLTILFDYLDKHELHPELIADYILLISDTIKENDSNIELMQDIIHRLHKLVTVIRINEFKEIIYQENLLPSLLKIVENSEMSKEMQECGVDLLLKLSDNSKIAGYLRRNQSKLIN